jgi:two-component system sensor histidine kinase GlrK
MPLTIFQRLTLGYLAIMLLVVASGLYGTLQLNRISRLIHQAANVDGESIRLAEDLSDRLTAMIGTEKKFWISGDLDFRRLFEKRQREFEGILGQLETLIPEPTLSGAGEELRHGSESYFQLFARRAETPKEAAPAGYEEARDAILRELFRNLRQIAAVSDLARDEKIRSSAAISTNVIRVSLGFALLCVLVGLAVSFLTTRRIVRPIVVLQRKTREIADGHFETIAEMKAPPEIRGLADDFNSMCERLRELDTLKEDFVRHVSHELRTPLTAIREASGMLLDGTVDAPESRGQLLTIVQTECERLIVSVNRILDLSRMESRMMEYRFEAIDLVELAREALLKLTPIAHKKAISLSVDAGGDLPRVRADREQLLQLLENLVGNALKFTDTDGSVDIRIEAAPGRPRAVQVSVSDTGCGIAPEHLERIFDKFRRIESGKGTHRGTGLGLSIAKHIVTAHGGRIWVESRVGAGSTFHCTLPVFAS